MTAATGWTRVKVLLVQEARALVLVVLAQAQAQAAGLPLRMVYSWVPELSCG